MNETPDNPYVPPETRKGATTGLDTSGSEGLDPLRKTERHALRNVRGLVDKLEAEHEDKRARQRNAIWLIVILGILLALFALGLPQNQMTPIDLPGVSASPEGVQK